MCNKSLLNSLLKKSNFDSFDSWNTRLTVGFVVITTRQVLYLTTDKPIQAAIVIIQNAYK